MEKFEFLHQLVDRVAIGTEKDKSGSIGLDKKLWYDGVEGKTQNPMRPPYEDWAAENGGKTKVYVTDELITKIDPKNIITSN